MELCETCLHRVVCGKYNATGGVKKCDNHKEERHGRWIWSEENECWVCSNCEMSALNNYRGNSTESNYCPNCGTLMDGGNEDG